VYKQWLVLAYVENPVDFPQVSTCLRLSETNHATAHIRNVLRNLKKNIVINIPISKTDPFTKEYELEWKSVGGNEFYEKVLNGSINMVSSIPDINRLFLTVNHLEGKDYLILRHPSKDYMLDVGDKFYLLFDDNEVLEFEIEKKSFHLYNSNSDTYKQVYENRILLFKEDLEILSQNLIKDWRILTSGNRKIQGMRHFGTNHNYQNEQDLKLVLKNLFCDYIQTLNGVENYEPISKLEYREVFSSEESCHLYLMKDFANGFYKIGISNNPSYREKTLQSEKPTIELMTSKQFSNRKVAVAFESSLHKTYENKRLRGEWFELTEKEVREIQEILR